MSTIFLETPRLILRSWQQSDEVPFIALNRDAEVMEYFPAVLTAAETVAMIGRMSDHIAQWGYSFFAVERKDNGEFIGFTGLSHPRFESYFTPCVEIGWRLSRANWGQGFATEAAKGCLAFGLEELKLPEIYSFTSVHNIRSQNVMKKIGMDKAGLFEHPMVEDGHFLKQHVLYKIER
jgi:RimJ/RimL family protein N-acetyltransferase